MYCNKWITLIFSGVHVFLKNLIVFFPLAIVLNSCNSKSPLFTQVSSEHSGIHFNNKVTESNSVNPLDLEFLYNGGGVSVGDFNNDSLPDLYFTASQASNKMYLNKGKFEFSDITAIAKVDGSGSWCNGSSVVDINNDGWDDIYVCTTIKKNPAERKNLLYINQGLNKEGVPTFKEMAAAYNLADTSFSVQAAFFDYDNDGDLDMYLLTTKLAQRNGAQFMSNDRDTLTSDVDKLFRNDWSDSLHHPVFTDVSTEAGIKEHGYGLGLAVADINKDGWKDIYVTNDFYSSDLLYINNKDGTFTNKANKYFKHTSQNAMGNDVADINNDGLADIISVDMNPADNYRKKKNMNANNYFIYQSMIYKKYMLQYVRNTLQLNCGPAVNEGDSTGDPVFSEIGFYAGVAQTDWSWNPSLADFNNDGFRDLIVTNGYPRDVTDHDFAAFRISLSNIASKEDLIDQIPQIKIPNYAFSNKGNLQFEDVSAQWGMNTPSFSNGAVYVDLDRDGDLDYVINNINDEAFVYKNTLNNDNEVKGNFVDVRFKGDEHNLKGIGAFTEIYYDYGKLQVYENAPCRGYLSSVDATAHFGLGKVTKIDSLVIRWPDRKKQVLTNVSANQRLNADIKNAGDDDIITVPVFTKNNIFTDITSSAGVTFMHQESDFIDFNIQRLLPHKLSQYGPGLAAGDVDGNGLDDIVVGGTGDYPPTILLQQKDGKFIEKKIPPSTDSSVHKCENMGVLLFDADSDGDLDLYFADGSTEFIPGTKNYQDRLYANDGKGNYALLDKAIPVNYSSKSCIKAVDIDNDGDLDLFVGGRVIPGRYPQPASSIILRNDSKAGNIRFTDITREVAPELINIGLVCDAIWTDFDNDGWIDLILAGEWMPVTFFKNNHGMLKNVTQQSGTGHETGWWNSITAGDFDNDGDIDYILGNMGENSFYHASDQYPVSIYAKDFDNNQSLDAIPTVYLPAQDGRLHEFPVHTRDDIVDQLPALKKKFLTYKDFAKAGIYDLFSKEEMKNALVLRANNLKSSYVENLGNGRFKMSALPVEAQMAPVYGMVAEDFDHDGNLDLALCGNDYGTEVTNGRYDAVNGLLLLGNGKGNFKAQAISQSGLNIPGDAKAMIKLAGPANHYLLAASQNRGLLKVFQSKQVQTLVPLQSTDQYLLITGPAGQTRKEELYFGSSFLSQSAQFISMNKAVTKVEIVNNKGEKRVIH